MLDTRTFFSSCYKDFNEIQHLYLTHRTSFYFLEGSKQLLHDMVLNKS